MRTITRFGVVAAATAFASVTALSGAALANADVATPVFDSPSSVSVGGKGVNTEVSYTNKSGEDLFCIAFAGPGRLLTEMYGVLQEGADLNSAPPAGLAAKLVDAVAKGQLGLFAGGVEDGETAALSSDVIATDAVLTDGSFTPAALAVCSLPGNMDAYEIEFSAGAGVPAGLGSLDSALAGIGSSGSVAQTTGSLGS